MLALAAIAHAIPVRRRIDSSLSEFWSGRSRVCEWGDAKASCHAGGLRKTAVLGDGWQAKTCPTKEQREAVVGGTAYWTEGGEMRQSSVDETRQRAGVGGVILNGNV